MATSQAFASTTNLLPPKSAQGDRFIKATAIESHGGSMDATEAPSSRAFNDPSSSHPGHQSSYLVRYMGGKNNTRWEANTERKCNKTSLRRETTSIKGIQHPIRYPSLTHPGIQFAEEEDGTPSVPGTPNSHLKRAFGFGPKIPSRPGTPGLPSSFSTHSKCTQPAQTIFSCILASNYTHKARHPLHPTQAIQTLQQFHNWFTLIEHSIQHSQEAHFRSHLSLVSKHLNKCDELLADVDGMDNKLQGMLTAWRGVEEGGRSLKGASEQLLEEKAGLGFVNQESILMPLQNRLLKVTEAINAQLEYFQELEHATHMLNHPGEDLVLQPDFLLMVEQVDVCLEFLQNHVCAPFFDSYITHMFTQPQYREAEIYILRFQQCLTRAMTLVKIFFVNSLRVLTTNVQSHLAERVCYNKMSSTGVLIAAVRTPLLPP